jgi:UDP-N-acetylmuramate--alanine ligase
MFYSAQRLHFTGIGGIGMSGLAELCLAAGCEVTGSDAKLSKVTARLGSLGIGIKEGHAAENLPAGATALIVTSAARADNAEVLEAKRRGLPVVLRGELLAELMKGKRGVAVGGSHGKTTTTSMLAQAALHAGLDPTVFVGTLAPFLGGSNARAGGELFITECDESDGSFLELAPEYAVITNIDKEHLDHWKTFEGVVAGFVKFANRVAYTGAVVACMDDGNVRGILESVRRRVIGYGREEGAELRIEGEESGAGGSRFRLRRGGVDLGEFRLNVLGRHNVLNAAAAAAVLSELGVGVEAIRAGLAEYRGTGRRMELRGEAGGVTVIDDYGHHPTEVKATLEALRLGAPARLVVLFQPHRYTRTALLYKDFGRAFGSADRVWVAPVYAASEKPLPGVNSGLIMKQLLKNGARAAEFPGALELMKELKPGDVFLTLGAGDVWKLGEEIKLKMETLT